MDEQRLRSDIRISRRYLEKLEAATNKYEQAISDLLITEKMDVNLKMAYTNKLTQQQKLTDPILVQLQTTVDFFDNKAACISACLKAKICSMQKAIEAKMDIILNTHKEEDMLSSSSKIKANLRLVDDVISSTTTELDVIYKQIAQEDLAEVDVEKLLQDAMQLVDSTRETATELRARLMQAAATINEKNQKRN